MEPEEETMEISSKKSAILATGTWTIVEDPKRKTEMLFNRMGIK